MSKDKKGSNAVLNDRIRANTIILIMEDGSKLGEISKFDALNLATTKGLDLLQVSQEFMPVCKLIDYGKFLYEKKKKEKANAAHHKHHEAKEIRTSPNISDHDLEIKHKKILEFLSKGFKVIYKMQLKDREKIMINQATQKFIENLKKFDGVATYEEIQRGGEGRKLTLSTVIKPSPQHHDK